MTKTAAANPIPYSELTTSRICVSDVHPVVDGGRYSAKCAPGEEFTISAVVFREGHDRVNATVMLYGPDGGLQQQIPMRPGLEGTDTFLATLRLEAPGCYEYAVAGWADVYATWCHAAGVKIAADVDAELMVEEGALLCEKIAAASAAGTDRPSPTRNKALKQAVAVLRDAALAPEQRFRTARTLLDGPLAAEPYREFLSTSPRYSLEVQGGHAYRGAWYEFFPRSIGAHFDQQQGRWISGNFATAAERLPQIAAMGFDVVYLPPIHPIGRTHRKGPNNTLTAGADDPGSPWAIGDATGGHEAIHPDLGTAADFEKFVAAASRCGLAVALDLALQCSPDHPWVKEHPEWFTQQADGSIAYAENPPKKYQDIYPLNFDRDPRGLSAEVLKIVLLWVSRGVKIFRVDNPHTKPVWFWEWLIKETRARHPEVVFLAEAFTRPAMMHTLAKVGFQQSYGYFTWRNTKEEIEEYLAEITGETAHFYRPNFFVNTPDILTEYLQFGGPAAFKIRAVLAATANPLWGVYSGFELCEHIARPGAEEYIDNEKYEYKPRDFAAAEATGRSLAGLLTRLNWIRQHHPCTADLANLTLHENSDEDTVIYSKTTPTHAGADTLIVVLATDPHRVHEGTMRLDLSALGLAEGCTEFEVEDLLSGEIYHWGEENYFRLDPRRHVAHIVKIKNPA